MVEFEQENVYWVICKFPSYSNDTVKTTESDFSNKHLFKLNINSFMTEVLYGPYMVWTGFYMIRTSVMKELKTSAILGAYRNLDAIKINGGAFL